MNATRNICATFTQPICHSGLTHLIKFLSFALTKKSYNVKKEQAQNFLCFAFYTNWLCYTYENVSTMCNIINYY